MRFSIIAIEDGFVFLEDENADLSNISVEKFPADIKEGQIVFINNGIYEIDYSETDRRRNEIFEKFNKIKKSKN